jgi:hypothetical protein
MKKIEAVEIEREDLEDIREAGSSSPRWRLKEQPLREMYLAELVIFSGQVVKNRTGRITADLPGMLSNW